MRSYSRFNNLFSRDRKFLYIVLSIVMISVLTLTVVYAALSTTLSINGNAEVTAASWDIYLDNVQLNSSSATIGLPTITNSKTVSFSTTLSKPGDYYMFTVDVVNNGTIDAMIDSVTKTPELSDSQKKYLNYIVEYENGESITTKQLVAKNSFVRLKVRVEYRKDITASDLPSMSETLNLSFKVNYVQSDENGISVKNDGVFKLEVVSGDYDTVGSEVAIRDEHFYIISSDDESITMLAKYNLYVGGKYESTFTEYGDEATGLQDSTMIGFNTVGLLKNGVTRFSSSSYWSSTVSSYPTYVYDSKSRVYSYVENYRICLESYGVIVNEARLIKMEELETLGCSYLSYSCLEAPEWVYATSYWIGTAVDSAFVTRVLSNGVFGAMTHRANADYGVRPVIKISKSKI